MFIMLKSRVSCVSFSIIIKHLKVMTEAGNVFEEEQMLQIAEVIPPISDASKTPFNPNQVDHEATADVWSEITQH